MATRGQRMDENQQQLTWRIVQERGSTTCERLNAMLHELRTRYSIERSELVTSVNEQVMDMRAELDVALANAQRTAAHAQQLERQVIALEKAHDGNPDLQRLTHEAHRKINLVHEGLRQNAEQTQLVKTALLNDRMRREERQRQLSSEDASLELRIRQLEESNASLRSELGAMKAANCEATEAVLQLTEESEHDAPSTYHAAELQRLHEEVVNDLKHIRADHEVLLGRISAVTDFCEKEEKSRKNTLQRLEETVSRIEARPAPAPYRPSVDTTLLPPPTNRNPRLTTSSSSGTTAAQLLKQNAELLELRPRLERFYARYNPGKASDIERIVKEYEGAEEELMSALEVHYNAFGYFSMDVGSAPSPTTRGGNKPL